VGGPPGPPPLPRPPSSYFGRIWVDTAVASAAHLEANLRVFGPERLVFGTDGPPILSAVEEAAALVAALPLDDDARAGVLGGNARELLALAPRPQPHPLSHAL
jgi:aminocarboxymuconate-semialdehyde decarboxylase